MKTTIAQELQALGLLACPLTPKAIADLQAGGAHISASRIAGMGRISIRWEEPKAEKERRGATMKPFAKKKKSSIITPETEVQK